MMKKTILALSVVLVGAQAFAAATLRIPVMININDEPTPAISINQKLAALGAPGVPLYVEISSTESAYKKMEAFQAMLANSLKPLTTNGDYVDMARSSVPTDSDTAEYSTCYKGNAEEVSNIVSGLTDVHYSDQLTMWGYKFKNQTIIFEGNEDTAELLNDDSALWRNWTGQTEDLLILSAIGDGGDDVQESLIPKCK
jgi:hypothetical protein